VSAVFWCIEAMDYINAVKKLKLPDENNAVLLAIQSGMYTLQLIKHLPRLWKLVVDVTVTILLAGAFGFNGMVGSIIGLSVSNVISLFLISIKKGVSDEHTAVKHVSR
jgi:hypothetical protein